MVLAVNSKDCMFGTPPKHHEQQALTSNSSCKTSSVTLPLWSFYRQGPLLIYRDLGPLDSKAPFGRMGWEPYELSRDSNTLPPERTWIQAAVGQAQRAAHATRRAILILHMSHGLNFWQPSECTLMSSG